jgi:hypothetical protein
MKLNIIFLLKLFSNQLDDIISDMYVSSKTKKTVKAVSYTADIEVNAVYSKKNNFWHVLFKVDSITTKLKIIQKVNCVEVKND